MDRQITYQEIKNAYVDSMVNGCENHNPMPEIDRDGVVHLLCHSCGFYGFCSIEVYEKYLKDLRRKER